MTSELFGPQRRLALEGAVNFRDLGGYSVGAGRQTRWGRVWRSDSLADLTEDDFRLLEPLGLSTLIDFRLPVERERMPNRLPPGAAIETVEIGFVPEGTLEMLRGVFEGRLDAAGVERTLVRHYQHLPIAHNFEYAQMFERIEAADGRPILIHCTSGKDRTGYGAALILLALGASRELVLEDYALTNLYRRDITFLFPPQTPRDVVDMLMSAQPKYLDAALSKIDETYGSADAYLEQALALTEARRERLRELLTEEVSESGAAALRPT
ncbi:MAG: tyrosine-protein phosphatase [Beijerinckiaceae bacterium]